MTLDTEFINNCYYAIMYAIICNKNYRPSATFIFIFLSISPSIVFPFYIVEAYSMNIFMTFFFTFIQIWPLGLISIRFG